MTELQSVITRVNPAVKPAILTFGSIHGGKACNVIPDQVGTSGDAARLSPGVQGDQPSGDPQDHGAGVRQYGGRGNYRAARRHAAGL
ncbi:hypothetical protein [Massilistercora timonensis]|uniref:hypothetical protein n=1 Tax=Massilistercora timonensis TaxID=2086584 RepID=UPI003208B05A